MADLVLFRALLLVKKTDSTTRPTRRLHKAEPPAKSGLRPVYNQERLDR